MATAPVTQDSHLYLVDASAYIFRAFHALPPLTRASDGLPIGAVSGFCNMLFKLLEDLKGDERPTHFACIFDASSHTFRNEIYDQYKANREEPPEELRPQFPLVRRAAEAFAAHPQVFVAPPDHPLMRVHPVTPLALEREPFIAREPGSGTRKHMEDFFARHRIAPPLAMEMPSNESIKQAVMAGMGLSFLSLHTIGLEVRSGLLGILDVQGAPIVRSWNVVHLSGRTLSPAAEALRYFVLEHGEAMLAAHDASLLPGTPPAGPPVAP